MTTRRRAAPWGNRIVKVGSVRAGDLLANPGNWRIHPLGQQEVLSGMLNEIGFVAGVIINARAGAEWAPGLRGVETLIDGHLRAELALSRDEDTDLPATWVDLSPEEEAVVLASFDPVGTLAVPDHEKLADLVQQMPEDLRALTEVLREERTSASRTVKFEATPACRVIVDCTGVRQRDKLARRLTEEGFACRTE